MFEYVELTSGTNSYDWTCPPATPRDSEISLESRCQYEGGQLRRHGNCKTVAHLFIFNFYVHEVGIVGRPRPKAIVFVNVRCCICVDVVHNAAFRACKICRCVLNMNWSETCKCLSWQRQEQTADLHGSSCVRWASLFRLPLKLPPREGTFLLSKLMFLVFLVIYFCGERGR